MVYYKYTNLIISKEGETHMCNIFEIARELRLRVPIGAEVMELGYYPEHLVKSLKKLGFTISHTFDGMWYYAHIKRNY